MHIKNGLHRQMLMESVFYFVILLDEDVFKDEESCKNVHHRSNLLEVSANHVHKNIRNHTEEDTV